MNPRASKVLPQTSVTSLALAKVSQQLVKPIYANAYVKKLTEVKTEAAAHESSSVATKWNKGMPASSENKRLLKEPSDVSVSREKPWRSLVKVGLNQLIIVSCEEKQQVYCQLCLVRLRTSSHSTSFTHCYNYVTMKYPEWITNVSNLEDRLGNIVDHLAAIDKDLGPQKPQKVEVKRDLYLTLATLSEKEAIEKLKAIVRQGPLVSSSAAEGTSQQKVSISFEVSSSDDGVCVQQKEISTFSADNRSGQKSRRLQQIRDLCVKGRNVKQEDLLFPLERRLIGSSSPSHGAPKAVDCSLQKQAGSLDLLTVGSLDHRHVIHLELHLAAYSHAAH
ncbi:uncharacterized protein LOC105930373 [Fundulus heteroclitus]|uniref:uncharacterized protein LOC105930373 n=1 Tax=Fundulus heteroclitus TaxID=8078 RepID=UPI00165C291D|nr:uncharacterized protein LOC105930373 [Fundulus heteroclitus]